VPYMAARRANPQHAHPTEEVLAYSATPLSYVSPVHGGPVLGDSNRWLARTHTEEVGAWEKRLFPGWSMSVAMLCVAGGAVWSRARRRGPPDWLHHASFALAIAVTGFVLSLGPRLGGDPEGFPLPFEVLTWTPGRLLRVPARFGSLVALGMALALALALARAPRRWRRLLVGTVLVGLTIELMPEQLSTVRVPDITAAHRAIAHQDGAVLALPTVEIIHAEAGGAVGLIEREPIHVYLSTAHFRPLVNGYSAFQPARWWDMIRRIQDFPSPASLTALRQRSVQTVVIEMTLTAGTRWETAAERLGTWPGVRLIASDGDVRVYDISQADLSEPSD
jgi:hypothetical protein